MFIDENEKMTWQEQIQEAIKEIAFIYCLSAKDLMPFLTATWCGQMAVCEYSEEFTKKTLDHMFENYLKIKKKNNRSK